MKRLLLAGLAVLFSCHAFAAVERWNILFIFADDWGRYASCYNGLDGRPTLNDVVKTPNIDRVAREGALFKNAFVNAPSCTPCRSSLMSGRYFFNCGRGAILNGAVWDLAIPSFPLMLRDSGYQIGKSYKVWSPGTPADAPIGGQQYAYEKAGRIPNKFSSNVTRMVGDGLTVEAAREKVLDQVRGNFKAFLADQKSGTPWLYFFGPTNTHRPWVKGSGKQLWGLDPESVKGKMPKFLPDVPEVREDVVDNLGEAQAVDAYVGVLVKMVEEAGQLDHTLIVISGDHGMGGMPGAKCNLYDFGLNVALVVRVPGGKGGRVLDDFVRLPDLAPTFMEVGGVKPPDGLYGRSLVDVLKSDKSGQVDPTRTWVLSGRERHVATAREGNLPYPMRCLRTADYLYIRNFAPDRWPMGAPYSAGAGGNPPVEELENTTYAAFPDMDASPTKAWMIMHRDDPQWKDLFERSFGKRPAEELYDLRKDPEQTKNVAADPAYAKDKEKLAADLMKKLQDAADPRVTGDGLTFERPPFTGGKE